jgi:hypothetical protein
MFVGRVVQCWIYVQPADSILDSNAAESSGRDLLRLGPLAIELANDCINTEPSDQVYLKGSVSLKQLNYSKPHGRLSFNKAPTVVSCSQLTTAWDPSTHPRIPQNLF